MSYHFTLPGTVYSVCVSATCAWNTVLHSRCQQSHFYLDLFIKWASVCQVFFFYTLFRLLWEFTYLIWHFFGFHKYTQLDWLLFLAPLLTNVSHLCSLDFCRLIIAPTLGGGAAGEKPPHVLHFSDTLWSVSLVFHSFTFITHQWKLYVSLSASLHSVAVTHTDNNSVRWSVLCR